MSITGNSRRANRLGVALVSLVALGALAIPLAPAKAQAWVQIGPFGVGVSPPAPYYYYGYPYYHHYPHYRHYYGYPYPYDPD